MVPAALSSMFVVHTNGHLLYLGVSAQNLAADPACATVKPWPIRYGARELSCDMLARLQNTTSYFVVGLASSLTPKVDLYPSDFFLFLILLQVRPMSYSVSNVDESLLGNTKTVTRIKQNQVR